MEIKDSEVQTQSFEKQAGGCDDTALQIQARSFDLGLPDLQVWIPSLKLG